MFHLTGQTAEVWEPSNEPILFRQTESIEQTTTVMLC
jgi:hypothetical protein